MVGLPDCIGSRSFSPVNQLKCVAVRFRAFVGERYEVSSQIADDAENGAVAGSLLTQVLGQPLHLPEIGPREATAAFAAQRLQSPV